jgi:hypothetical protein
LRTSLTLVFALAAIVATADSTQLNRDLSSLYVTAIEDSVMDIGNARALVNAALDFDPVSSDALFLRAYLDLDKQEETSVVLRDFQSAISNNNFAGIDANHAAIGYATVLLRTRMAEEALAVLDAADLTAPDVDMALVANAHLVRARALRQLGRGLDADSVIAQARSRFPDDAGFFLLELESEPSPSFRYRRELDRLMRAGADGPAMLAALLQYAITAPIVEEKRWASATYLERGGQDPSIALALAGSDEAGMVDTFIQLGGYRRRDVFLSVLDALPATEQADEQMADTAAASLRDRLLAAAGDYNGFSLRDGDGDGFWEERITLSDGAVVRWEIDSDQDGTNEVDLSFSGGEPVQVIVEQPPGLVVVAYESYPFVRSVTVPQSDGSIRFNIQPYGIQTPAITRLPVGGPRLESELLLPAGFAGVDLLAVQLAALEREERNARGRIVEVQGLDHGVTVTSRRDSNGDARMDHLVVFEAGLPSTGLRDIDGDGYFEVAEGYDAGRLVMVSVDEDDNGTPDVTEYTNEDGQRDWDLDQDGTIDVREFGIWTNSVRLQFPFLETRR